MDVPAGPESDMLLLPLRTCRETLCGAAFLTTLPSTHLTNRETETHREEACAQSYWLQDPVL